MAVTPIMQRILATRAIKLKDGKLRIWGIPAAIYSLFSICYITRLLEKGYAGKDVLYWAGYHQSVGATRMMTKRFGYKKKIIENVAAHSTMLGLGAIDPVVINFKKKLFVFRQKSECALEYLKEYGLQSKPACHFLRGQCAGTLDELFKNEKFVVLETKCMAKGDRICEIVAKPKKEWDARDINLKEQLPEPLPSPEELGYRRESLELPQRGA
jgi:predicted hydrocarbon binding protein